MLCKLGQAAGLLGRHHSAQMPSWRDDPHDRHGVTAGWASANQLPGNYVNLLHAGTLPGPQFRLVKDAERAARKERLDGRMGARQRDALVAALKKAPPPEPTRSTRNDSVKDKKIQALEMKVQALEKCAKTRARAPLVSRGRAGSRSRGRRDEPAPVRHGGGADTATPAEALTSRRARRAAHATSVARPSGAMRRGLGCGRRWLAGSGRKTGYMPRTWHPRPSVNCAAPPPSGLLAVGVVNAAIPWREVP